MKKTWIANYENNEIKVENTWFDGERLFVNNELQDHSYGFASAKLSGSIIDESGKKRFIKVRLGGAFSILCHIFVDDKAVTVTAVK